MPPLPSTPMPMPTSRPTRVVVAVSPAAAFGRHHGAGDSVCEVLEAAGHAVVPVVEQNFELLRREVERELENAAESGALVVVGGDGMVSLGVNAVAQTGIPLGVVPIGTGNDTARNIGMPIGEPAAAGRLIAAALERPPHAVDAALVTHGVHSTWVVGVVSAGFDAAVNERANVMTWPKSQRRYTIAVVSELFTFRAPRYRLTVDGESREFDAMLVAVANHSSIGGGMRIAPAATMDDGLLDLVVVERMSKPRFLRVFPKVFRGEHTELPEVRIERVQHVRIEADGVVAYGDGERIGPPPLELSVVPGAVLLLH
ncbi:diacylglycerol/lipid kinase family protein [Gryllotalpicola reticulitermitis]|uniref:Diacylglycerol/lipid kinase family protein n=1 Tax=Gryllotalpicola reticulitermitis TaxID=1184153 RepID=A0ABV8Q4I7_9MICO